MHTNVTNKRFGWAHSDTPSRRRGLRYSGAGFTLIEAVVAVSIFAITATSIVGVYLSVQKLNQQSAALQALQQNGRFVTEDLTKTIRNGQIDYARYAATYGSSGVPQPWASELFLLDRDSVAVRVYQSGNELVIEKGGIGSSTFTGQGVKVLDYKVYIWPALNPFSGGSVQEQPTATLFLNLESNLNPRDVVRLPFQITVATRQYSQ